MINGPMVGGLMIAGVFIWSAVFAGCWFRSSLAFEDAHALDASRSAKPTVCSFNTDEFGGRTTGTIYSRGGLMRFDVRATNEAGTETNEWGAEVDMNDATRMMTRSGAHEPFVSLDSYPDLRVQVLQDLNKMIKSEKLYCAPWWSANGFRFALEGSL